MIGWASLVRYSGPAGVLVLWLGTIINVHKTNLNLLGSQPLSSMGVDPRATGLFLSTLVLSAVLFSMFAIGLYKDPSVPKSFVSAMLLGHLGEALTGIIPLSGSTDGLHRFVAYLWAFSLPVSMYLYKRSPRLARIELLATIGGIGSFILIGRALPVCQIVVALPFHYWVIQQSAKRAAS
jgi:hypothetical protein